MNLLLVITFLSFICFDLHSQEAKHVEGKRYEGYVFSDSFDVLLSIENQKGRFTPNEKVIEEFECNLHKSIDALTQDLPNQGKECPKINKRKLKKYARQYFGFYNNNNEYVLFVNFVWKGGSSKAIEGLSKDLVNVLDGCTLYWSIQYNIEKDEFNNLSVNTRS